MSNPVSTLYASTFDDEFSSFVSSPTGTVSWATELPFWGSEHTLHNEAEYYVDSSQPNSPFSVANGVLTIEASQASTTGANPLGLSYNSGVMTTYKSFSQLYGYFEVRAQLPSGAGLWPAFWLMPTGFKPGPELDVFEVLGDRPNILYSTVHSADPQGGLLQPLIVPDTSAAFHTYGVDWGPKTTVFYEDGQAIASAATPADMNVPMYMLLNLAVGGAGSWPGAPTSQTQFPADMKIDFVHAYQTANTIGWTDPTPSLPTPLVLPALQAATAGSALAYVFVEHYGNQDAGTPLAGIGVALRNAAGLIVATGVTGPNGFYTFSNLAAGTYSVQYITAGAYSVRAGGFADATTGVTGSFSLSPGQSYGVPYQLVTSSAELAGTVQLDGGNAAGISVTLLDVNSGTRSTTQTDATGRFSFWVAAGQYTVKYDAPAGTSLVASALADATGLSVPIVLADGQKFLVIPEQLVSRAPKAIPSPLTLALSSDTGASASDKITSSAGLAGGGSANATITVRNGNTLLGTTTADSQGHWLFTPTDLADGSYTLTASEVDVANNTSYAALTFVLDTIAPAVTETLARDTGASSSDKITSSAALFGNGDANATVMISNGGSVLGTATADSQGHWSFTPSGLVDGSYTLAAKEIDAAGNNASAMLSFVLDTRAPSVTIKLLNDTGTSNSDRITSSAGLTGSGDPHSVVTISKGATVLGTTVSDIAGNWSYSPYGLSNGITTLTATETDAAGNIGTATATITLDTIAPKPAVTIITGIAGGGVTLSGTSEANSTVTVADTSNGSTTVVGTATTGANGAWSLTSHIVVDVTKVHVYNTTSTDIAGNAGATTGSLYLASTGNDTLAGKANVSDVFAIMSFKGSDVINSFEASSVVGANHDYIDFSGRGITSFSQVQSMMSGSVSTIISIGSGKTITVSDIAPSILTAADFRYS